MGQVNASIADFERRTNTQLGKVDGHFARLSAGVSKFNSVLAGAAGGLAAGFFDRLSDLPGTLIGTTKAALEFAGSLGEAAQQLGVSAKFMQEFRFAADQSGATTEQADKAIAKLSVTLGQAFNDGASKAGKTLRDLGLNLTTLARQSDTDRYLSIADAISKIADPTQRAAAQVAVFGKAGMAVLPVTEAGAKGFKEFAAQAETLGIVLSDANIQSADKTADKLAALNMALKTNVSRVVAENKDAIESLADAFFRMAGKALQATTQLRGFLNIYRSQGLLAALSPKDGNTFSNAASLQGTRDLARSGFIAASRRLDAARRGNAPAEAIAQGQRDQTEAAQRLMNARYALTRSKIPEPPGRTQGLADVTDPEGLGSSRSRSGGSRTKAVRAVKEEVDALKDVLPETVKLLNDLQFTSPEDSPSGQFYRKLLDSQGIDPEADLKKIADNATAKYSAVVDQEAERRNNAIRFSADLYQDLFSRGTTGLWDSFRNIGTQVITEVLGKLTVNALKGGKSLGSLGSLFSSAFSSIQGFAGGGSPPVGRVSMVGEKGPELFVPSVKGTIIPNNMLGGGGGNTTIVNRFVLNSPVMTQDLLNQMNAIGVASAGAAHQMTMNSLSKSASRRL